MYYKPGPLEYAYTSADCRGKRERRTDAIEIKYHENLTSKKV